MKRTDDTGARAKSACPIDENLTLAQIDEQINALQRQKLKLQNAEKNRSKPALRYSCSKQGNRRVVVIGGGGQLGSLFVEMFRASGYQIEVIEAGGWSRAAEVLLKAALVVVAVPIAQTDIVIQQLGELPEDCVLADVTSVKRSPMRQMLTTHSGSVVGLHPMFGPDVADFSGQTVVVCHGREKDKYQWLIQQFSTWRVNTVCCSAQEHDRTMAFVQVLRHFSTTAYGQHLAEEKVDLERVLQMSSPIYRLELAMVGRLFAQDPELYTEIIFSEPENIEMMQRFIDRFQRLLTLMQDGDKIAFKGDFLRVRDWFGDYAEKFLQESSQLLKASKGLNRL